MKKVININFQGRIIPIEETAYEMLKQYVESLRRYFANEEGRDEIVNDIESRIAELFSERLKNGATCIADEDVQAVIAGMGRPEDFDAQNEVPPAFQGQQQSNTYNRPGRGRSLYRNADDKIIGGVCSGLSNYLGIDPIIMRIVFVALFGLVFWVYILLWIIVPSRSVQSNITKRLYRSSEQKVVAGVCGGIAAYFNIDIWIPRLIFAFPFIIALASGTFQALWLDWDPGFLPRIISGSFGWTLFITYIILWIAVPVANTSSEKLEMRGERVDLNSIRNTVKEDMENIKTKTEKWGAEVKQTAQQLKSNASSHAKTFTAEAMQATRRGSSGIARAIGVLLRVFFIVAFAIFAIALFGMFIAMVFGSVALAPLKGFLLEGTVQNTLAWTTMFLFFVIPIIALITWAIRRIMGVRSKSHYTGLIFSGLWVGGLLSGIILFVMIAGNFKNTSSLDEEQLKLGNVREKLIIDVEKTDWKNHNNKFFGIDVDGDWPIYSRGNDSVLLNTVRISMVKSNDSAFHVYRVRSSRGSSEATATALAEKIIFEPVQMDSSLLFPRGFYISRADRFRNQRVWIVVEIPVGKAVTFGDGIKTYDWVDIRLNSHNIETDEDWNTRNNIHWPVPGRTYRMNADGRPEKAEN